MKIAPRSIAPIERATPRCRWKSGCNNAAVTRETEKIRRLCADHATQMLEQLLQAWQEQKDKAQKAEQDNWGATGGAFILGGVLGFLFMLILGGLWWGH